MSLSDRIVDEGLLSRIKDFVAPTPPKNTPVQRKRPRRPATSAPAGPPPRHPAFQKLAQQAVRRRSNVDPKATTVKQSAPTQTRANPAFAATTTAHHANQNAATEPHSDSSGTLATRHKPGTLAHTVHLFRQAKEIRSQINRPVHVVQHGSKRYITTKPSAQHKILHTYEHLREAIRCLRALLSEATVASAVGPFMGAINGARAVDVRSEDPKRKKPKKSHIPLIRRSGPAGTGE